LGFSSIDTPNGDNIFSLLVIVLVNQPVVSPSRGGALTANFHKLTPFF